ncbi:MAG: hypothetical protein GWP66_01410 [Gammaproteobacteria bacterium]|jgi:hypothetical protein|nr:hypothetical protein [Gammaproteobacteria bacterium]
MVDEQAFRSRLDDLDKADCPFAKALLGSQAACSRARRYYLADREGVECSDAVARMNCTTYFAEVRGAAGPRLGATAPTGAMPHGVAMKLQVGGLRGLAEALGEAEAGDVAALVAAAISREGGLDALPFESILEAVAAFEPRRRRG